MYKKSDARTKLLIAYSVKPIAFFDVLVGVASLDLKVHIKPFTKTQFNVILTLNETG